MSTPPLSPEEREKFAAEFALGVLSGDDRARARFLYAGDAQFRAEVAQWLGRLAPLLDAVDPVEPPAGVWQAIERRLGSGGAANDNNRSLRRKLNLWRGAAAGASALAASLVLVLLTRTPEVAPPITAPAPLPAASPMIAMLGDEQKGALLVASWTPATNSLRLSAAGQMPEDPGRAHELWVIPADGTPRSLGTMAAGPKMQMAVDPQQSRQLQEGATLAVSVEPPGGSPTGLPTGPVIASGKLERA